MEKGLSLGLVWTANIGIAVAGIVVTSILLIFYAQRIKEIRSRFSIALAVFCFLFLVQNVVALFTYIGLAQRYSIDVALPIMAISVLELMGIGVLVWAVYQ